MNKTVSFKTRALWVAVMLVMLIVPAVGPAEEAFTPLPQAGKAFIIGPGYSGMWEFSEKPKMGTVVLKIVIYNNKEARDTSLKITGESGMPSMRGHHESGDVEFKLNKNGDYLMPVNIVMPGEWDVRIKFIKDGKVIYRGVIEFDV
ncbi:MAG: hypothetical protein AB1724_13295 [Thermodesulfobacteriota bacterium]